MTDPASGDEYGPYRINPAFDRFPEEARLVGKLLAGFGELEYCVCRNAAHASDIVGTVGAYTDVMRALYRLRTTASRIDAADALSKRLFGKAGLEEAYVTAHAMVRACQRVRNQFAHCNWTDAPGMPEADLFFTDLQAAAEAQDGFDFAWRHIDVKLLENHVAYFALTREWLSYLDLELAVKRGRLSPHPWPAPPERAPPPLHNPPEKHVPPWLDEDQKALHVARARAAQGGAPTPTPAQQALDAARAAKKARRKANHDRSKAHSGREKGKD